MRKPTNSFEKCVINFISNKKKVDFLIFGRMISILRHCAPCRQELQSGYLKQNQILHSYRLMPDEYGDTDLVAMRWKHF